MRPASRHGRTTACLLVLTFLAADTAAAPTQQPDKRRSPRATVQTLYTAINAARQNPKYVEDAVACLDLTDLPPDQRDPQLLAFELEAVLRAAEITTERIPEETASHAYTLPGPDGGRITLRRQPDGRWLFDRDTVAQVPQMNAAARKLLQDKNKEAAALNIAPEVASPRATFRTFLTANFTGDPDRALRCLSLNEIPAAARQEVGQQLGHKLCQIILRNRSVIYQDLPDSNYSDTYVWLSHPEGSIELVRLPTGEHKGEWVFSRQTVRSIDRLYHHFEDKPYHEMLLNVSPDRLRPDPWRAPELCLRDNLPAWSKADVSPVITYRVELYQVAGLAVATLLAVALTRLGSRLLAVVVRRTLALAGWDLPPATVLKRLRPTGRLLACLLVRWAILLLDVDKGLLGLALTALNPLAWVLASWAAFRLIDLLGDLFEVRMAESKHRVEITEMLWPVGSLATKIVLALGVVLHLMAMFSWDLTAVLTGVGIGGVAFALGAQDSLRNLFGSFTLIADRPFVVGETVQIGDGGLGVVERVGLRSTSIRTVEDTLMVVPNSNLTTMNITNFGRRRFRRFTSRIGVVYGTPPERLAALRDGIRQLLLQQPSTRKEQCEVAIHDLTDSAIEIQVSVYFDVTTGHEEAEAREALLLGCLRLAEELQIDLAYPTQTVHLVTDPEVTAPALSLHTGGAGEGETPKTGNSSTVA
jgi:MscS family membrane protein